MDSKGFLSVTPEEVKAAIKSWNTSMSESKVSAPKTKSIGKPVPTQGRRNVLVTSALPYVNNVPHLGNIVGCVLSADVFARFCRLRGYNTLYICGTDEHGTTTEAKALEENLTPREICDKYHAIHKEVYEWFDISFDHFGRTTTPNMAKVITDVFWKLHKNGNLTEDSVDQLHCQQCDKFLADRFVEGSCPHCKYEDARGDQCDSCGKLINAIDLGSPRCKTCGSTPSLRTSKHVFIDLPKVEDKLNSWYEASSKNWTNNAKVIGQSWLKAGLQARCITRDLKWGTRVPMKGYEDKVFYVWFEAPFGYVSITADYMDDWEKWWKNPDNVVYYAFMAKDNVPFHSIVFPASQLGSETSDFKWTKVNHLMSTEYLNYEDEKFSKSRGIGVFGNDARATNIPADVWRFYLAYTRPESADSSFRWEDLALKNNSELLANLGNFVNRASKFLKDNFEGKIAPIDLSSDDDKQILAQINKNLTCYVDFMEKSKQRDSVSFILNISRLGNQLMQSEQPWKKNKSDNPNDRARAASVVSFCVNISALLAVLIEPFMPGLSRTILEQLNTSLDRLNTIEGGMSPTFRCMLKPGHVIGSPAPLIREIKTDEIKELQKRFSGPQSARQPASLKSSEKKLSADFIAKLEEAVTNQGNVVRILKDRAASAEVIDAGVDLLLFLKGQVAEQKGEPHTQKASSKKGGKKK